MHPSRARATVVLVLAALAPGCPETHAPTDAGASDAAPAISERDELLAALDRGEERVVLVLEDEGREATARHWLEAMVSPNDWAFAAEHMPIIAVRIDDRPTLEAIERAPGVIAVEPNRAYFHDAIPSLEMIGQPAAIARGADGRGRSVAVLDTGADYTRPELGACSAPGPDCGVIYAQDFARADGTMDDTVRHGTNVASIVRLVAPQSRIVALDVFDGRTASSLDLVRALDWVISERATHAIVAVNMSLGYGGFSSPCGTDVMATAVARVRAAGIVPVVAAGNDGFTSAISSPACAPASVSVGAVDRTGAPASFSNSASFLTLLAPGTSIDAGGVIMSGTSQAAPHVAGAVAALLSAYPGDGVDALVARLVGTGVATADPRNGLSFRRVSLDAATAGGATAPPPDVTAPTGMLMFVRAHVASTAAAFTLSASDASGVASMCLSTATTCTTFVPYAPSGTFTLPTGDGLKTVRAWLRDTAGNTSITPLSATVTLDTRVPTSGTLTAARGIGRVTLSISGATDAGSGIVAYRVVFGTGTSSPSSCAPMSGSTMLAESAGPTWTHEGLPVGTTYRYRVCAIDRAGNLAPGATAAAAAVPELNPPTGTVRIENDAPWARTTRVTVALTASDASRVTHVCLSSTTSCTAWLTYASSLTFNLATGTGARPVYAWFRDEWGNASSSPASDTILLDTTLPPNPAVSVVSGDGQLTLRWAAGTDSPSGMSGYVVAHASGTVAPACSTGVAALPAVSGMHERVLVGLTNGTTYAYRVCAVDVAGNVSSGTTGTAIPAPEHTAPTPESIVIAAGAAWTRVSLVGISLAASDASSVASMCLSTTTTCTRWTAYTPSTTFILGTSSGTRTVSAWFRDVYGNTSAPISDRIGVDAVAPTNPVVTALAAVGAVEISFAPATDAGSGVASYLLVWGTGTAAPPCIGGTVFEPGAARAQRIETTAPIRWRVCALDAAGNASTGTTGYTAPR